MQGRLFGKRIQIEYFLDEVVEHGVEGCNYLLALDMEMEPVPGYEMANWEKGYGDFGDRARHGDAAPDPVARPHGARAVRRRQPRRLAGRRLAAPGADRRSTSAPREMGYTPQFASELEFYLYKESYAEAHEKDYRDLTPTIPYILDYHILATTMDEPYLGPIRRGMHDAGIPVEFSKGEAWYGQHEVNTRYADAVTSADRHTIYKNGVKEIAFLNGISATFMAKPSEKDIGSSCHIHSSLVDGDGKSVFVDGDEETDTFRHYLGGMREHIRELALFVAPSINSYKRYATESWAPTSISWGRDNRTCGFRIVGHGQSRRVECRIPGADVNPYLGDAALLAAGLDGIENETDPGPGAQGQRVRGRRGRAVPLDPARGARALGGQRLRQARLRRGGAQALPQLRPVRAEGVRPGRHRLRAPAHVRARLALATRERLRDRDLRRGRAGPARSMADEVVTMVQRTYPTAVQRAGALALVLPPDDAVAESPDLLLDRVDGLLLAGGADVDPASYGAAPHPETGLTWPERDRFEIALAARAIDRGIPVLGACRGMEILNVALRGHAAAAPAGRDRQRPPPPHAGAVRRPRGDARAGLAGRHGRPEPSAAPSSPTITRESGSWGRASSPPAGSPEDGVVEAIELPGEQYVLGVLWHPEEDEPSRVIASLVDAARAKVGAA